MRKSQFTLDVRWRQRFSATGSTRETAARKFATAVDSDIRSGLADVATGDGPVDTGSMATQADRSAVKRSVGMEDRMDIPEWFDSLTKVIAHQVALSVVDMQ